MLKNNKGQFLILSAMFLIILVIFSYSLETKNSYIIKSGDYNLVNNIYYEGCKIMKNSIGLNLENSKNNFSKDLSSYCFNLGYTCLFNATNTTNIPYLGNWSWTNYSQYKINIDYNINNLSNNQTLNGSEFIKYC